MSFQELSNSSEIIVRAFVSASELRGCSLVSDLIASRRSGFDEEQPARAHHVEPAWNDEQLYVFPTANLAR